jgi:hypothetical protein
MLADQRGQPGSWRRLARSQLASMKIQIQVMDRIGPPDELIKKSDRQGTNATRH